MVSGWFFLASLTILYNSGNLVPRAFSLKNGCPPTPPPPHFLREKPWGRSCPRGHFHFFHFIYFHTVFSVSSSGSDARTYFQIETPSSVDFLLDTFDYKKKKVVPCLRFVSLRWRDFKWKLTKRTKRAQSCTKEEAKRRRREKRPLSNPYWWAVN